MSTMNGPRSDADWAHAEFLLQQEGMLPPDTIESLREERDELRRTVRFQDKRLAILQDQIERYRTALEAKS